MKHQINIAHTALALLTLLFHGCIGHDYTHWSPKANADHVNLPSHIDLDRASTDAFHRVLKGFDLQHRDRVELPPAQAKEHPPNLNRWVPEDMSLYSAYDTLKIRAAPWIATSTDSTAAEIVPSTNSLQRLAEENRLRLELMYADEVSDIAQSKGKSGKKTSKLFEHRVGLALSGGGVRAASFASGVLQALHEDGFLDQTGYLSTVSGGGYAGSWYMVHDNPNKILSSGSRDLKHLTQFGHYLTAGNSAGTRVEAACNLLLHILGWPIAAFTNEIPFHWQRNTQPSARDTYRAGIDRAFHYSEALKHDAKPAFRDSDSIRRYRSAQKKPFWIVNMHLSLDDPQNLMTKNRSGDAFELTPLRAGSQSTGYVSTHLSTNSTTWWMNPSYAVAISGAALDSTSWEQGSIASTASYLLNFDLGYFIPGWSKGWCSTDNWVCTNNFLYYIKSIVGISHMRYLWDWAFRDHNSTVDAKRYTLTDGGHFTNLGAYALVQRGCRTIIICDASTDPAVHEWNKNPNRSKRRSRAFESLRRFEKVLYTDFGAILELDWQDFDISSSGPGRFTDQTPPTVITGKIRNLPVANWPTYDGYKMAIKHDVKIVYIKAAYDFDNAMRRSATFIDKQKGEHPEFPNESIGDQFFSEQQVNSYRRYGYELTKKNYRKIKDAVDYASAR